MSLSVSKFGRYCTNYKKGVILEDKIGMGFFCFKTKEDAKKFAADIIFAGDTRLIYLQIIKIQPLSKGYVPKKIAASPYSETNIDYFYAHKKKILALISTDDVPQGTICYKKIKVLD